MVKTLGINAQNDIYLGRDGNLALLDGLPAVSDACLTATRAQLGEMILATGQGIPNFQAVWIGTPKYPIFESYLRSTLAGVSGVLNVSALEIRKTGNVLQYTATIQSEFGTTELNNG